MMYLLKSFLSPSILQILKFGIVGGLATLTHAIFYILFVEQSIFEPLAANVAAYCIAFIVSFVGHFRVTFAGSEGFWLPILVKFLFVSLLGLGLNVLNVYLITDLIQVNYIYSLPGMVFLVPLLIFFLSKFWAFKEKREARSGL